MASEDKKYSEYANPGALISADELHSMLGRDDLKVVDFRAHSKYLLGHIHGAVNTWRTDIEDPDQPQKGMRAKPEQFKKFLESRGISHDSLVIIYDEESCLNSSRMWWIMALYGHDMGKIRLLDGGLHAWEASGYKTTISGSHVESGSYIMDPGSFRHELLAEIEDVQGRLGGKDCVILDARSESEWDGSKLMKGAGRKGRVPGAVWLEWKEALNGNKEFRDYDELKSIFTGEGVSSDNEIITYCQLAVRATHSAFVLTQLLGYENVRVYDGSWMEWSSRDDLPVETGS